MRARVVILIVATLLAGTAQAGDAAPATRIRAASTSPLLPLYLDYSAFLGQMTVGPAPAGRARVDALRKVITQVQAAGVSGFIVDWRNDQASNERLSVVSAVAAALHFHVTVRYLSRAPGRRGPLAVRRVAADLRAFTERYAGDSTFSWLGGPAAVIWSGTPSYSRRSVAEVTALIRPQIRVLATEDTVAGFQRLSGMVDGDALDGADRASADASNTAPSTLAAMGAAVHSAGKYWLAPLVDHPDQGVLFASYATAIGSSPDALQSRGDGPLDATSLLALGELRLATAPDPPTATDSSNSGQDGGASGPQYNLLVLVGFPIALAVLLGLIARQRRSRRRRPDPR